MTTYAKNAVLYNGAFEITLQAIGGQCDEVILAGVVSIDVSQEDVKQFAVLEWKVHPHHHDHPCLASSKTSTDLSIIQQQFEDKVVELSNIPWHDWQNFEAYCFDKVDFETWAQRGKPFEVEETYWFNDRTFSFMMEVLMKN